MNRKKLKTIITLALALTYFTSNSLTTVYAFADTTTNNQTNVQNNQTTDDKYKNFITTSHPLEQLNSATTASIASQNKDTTTFNNIRSSTSTVDKDSNLKLLATDDKTYFPLTPTSITNGLYKYDVPFESIYNNFKFTLEPKKNITKLNALLQNGNILEFNKINANLLYVLPLDIDSSSTFNNNNNKAIKSLVINYEDNTSTYIDFNYSTATPSTFSNIKKDYVVDDNKNLNVDLSFNINGNYIENNNRILINNELKIPTKKNTSSFNYENIKVDTKTTNNSVKLYTCDNLFQIYSKEVNLNNIIPISFDDETLNDSNFDTITHSIFNLTVPKIENDNDYIEIKTDDGKSFRLDKSHNSAAIDTYGKDDFNLSFYGVSTENNSTFKFTKKYTHDKTPLTIDSIKYHPENTPSYNFVDIYNNDAIKFDDKQTGTFPINIYTNKKLKDIKITDDLGNNLLPNDFKLNDSLTNNLNLKLTKSSTKVTVKATDQANYAADYNFTVDIPKDKYNVDFSNYSGSVIKIDNSNYKIISASNSGFTISLLNTDEKIDTSKLKIKNISKYNYTVKENNIIFTNIKNNIPNIGISYTDSFNRDINYNVNYFIDSISPTLTFKDPSPQPSKSDLSVVDLSFDYSDEGSDSNIKEIPIINSDTNLAKPTANTIYFELTNITANDTKVSLKNDTLKTKYDYNTNTLKGSFDFKNLLKNSDKLTDGTYRLKVISYDDACNKSNIISKDITIDNNDFQVNSKIPSDSNIIVNKVEITSDTNNKVISLNEKELFETNAKYLKSLTYKLYKANDLENEISLDTVKENEGNYVIKAIATDLRDNSTITSAPVKFSVDLNAPIIKVCENNDIYTYNTEDNKYYLKKDKNSFKVNITDTFTKFDPNSYILPEKREGFEEAIKADEVAVFLYPKKKSPNYNDLYADILNYSNTTSSIKLSPDMLTFDEHKNLNINFEKLKLVDGEYCIDILASDSFNQVNTASYNLVVDNLKPQASTNEYLLKHKGLLPNVDADADKIEKNSFYSFNSNVNLNFSLDTFTKTDVDNNFNIKIDEVNLSKVSVSINKVNSNNDKTNYKTQTFYKKDFENNKIPSISLSDSGIYEVKYTIYDFSNEPLEKSVLLAVLKKPEITLGYLDNGEFKPLKKRASLKNLINPVVKVKGVLGYNLDSDNKRCGYLTKFNQFSLIETDETYNQTKYNQDNLKFVCDNYSEGYFKLANIDNSELINLQDGRIRYNIQLSDIFDNSSNVLNSYFSIESNKPKINTTFTLKDKETNKDKQIDIKDDSNNFIQSLPKIDFTINKNYSDLDPDCTNIIITKVDKNGARHNVTSDFKQTISTSNFTPKITLEPNPNSDLTQGYYEVNAHFISYCENDITSNFSFIYDEEAPTCSVEYFKFNEDGSIGDNENPTNYENAVYTSNDNIGIKFNFHDNSDGFYAKNNNPNYDYKNAVTITNSEGKAIFNGNSTTSKTITTTKQTLPEGKYNINIESLDKSSNKLSTKFDLIVDKTKPVVKNNSASLINKCNLPNESTQSFYAFDSSLDLNISFNKATTNNNKNSFNIEVDEPYLASGTVEIKKVLSDTEEITFDKFDIKRDETTKSFKEITKTIDKNNPGIYEITAYFVDLSGNQTPYTVKVAVVTAPKITLGYLDSNKDFKEMKNDDSFNTNITPALKINGVLGTCSGKDVSYFLDKSSLKTLTSSNKEGIENILSNFKTLKYNGYTEQILALQKDQNLASLSDGLTNFNIQATDMFKNATFDSDDAVKLNGSFAIETKTQIKTKLNAKEISLADTKEKYINETPNIDIDILDNYSKLLTEDSNGNKIVNPNFKVVRANGKDDIETDCTSEFILKSAGYSDYCSKFKLVVNDTNSLKSGIYTVNLTAQPKSNCKPGSQSFTFVYDAEKPSYTIDLFKDNQNLNQPVIDEDYNVYIKDNTSNLKFNFKDNSTSFTRIPDATKLNKSISIATKDNPNFYKIAADDSTTDMLTAAQFNANTIYDVAVNCIDTCGNTLNTDKFKSNFKLYVDNEAPTVSLENNPIYTMNKENPTDSIKCYTKKDYIPEFKIQDLTPNTKLTVRYTLNNTSYSCSADKFNEELRKEIERLKTQLTKRNECKIDLSFSVTDLLDNSSTNNNYKFIFDSEAPQNNISVSGTDITKNTDIRATTFNNCNNFEIKVNDSNLNKQAFIERLKIRYLDTVSNNPTKDVIDRGRLLEIDSNNLKPYGDGYMFTMPLPGNGYYYVESTAIDFSNNSDATSSFNQFFTVDNTNINASLSGSTGFIRGKHYNTDLTFSVNVASHIAGFINSSYSLTRNGINVTNDFLTSNFDWQAVGGNLTFTLPTNSAAEGIYTFNYNINSLVGKSSDDSFNFIVDRTAPTLSNLSLNLGNGKIVNGVYYSNAESPNIRFNSSDTYTSNSNIVKKATINNRTYDLSGDYIPNELVAAEGTYNITISLTDEANNTSNYNYTVVVDRTRPSLSVNGFDGNSCSEDNEYYINHNITPQISVSDTNSEDIGARTISLDGSVYPLSTITSNGKHNYKVTVSDYAGNTTQFEKSFILDTVFPVITVDGVINNKYYNKNVTPSFRVDDITAKLTASLNSSSYDGATLTKDGDYILTLVAVDRALNRTEVKIIFTIDTVAPIITIKGILENQVNGGKLTPLISVDDARALINSLLNGEDYFGGDITESGKYTLIVRAVDLAGNVSTKSISFTLDATLPQIVVDGLENGKFYTEPVKPKVSASKDATIEMTLNGKPYNGEEISEKGDYELVITATDKLSNKSKAVYKFTIGSKEDAKKASNNGNNNKSNSYFKNISAKVAIPVGGGILIFGGYGGFMLFRKRKL